MEKTTKGTITIVSSFLVWGGMPIYLKTLKHVPATQILAHRVVWALLFVALLLSIQRRWGEAKNTISSYPNLRIFFVTSFLLGTNWLIYIWAINTNQIVETSLGYFINPLLNVCLGTVFLRERLYRWQTLSVGIAFIAVLLLTWQYGRVPWIALTLALTFGIYGLLRKTASAESTVGLLCESVILTPFALVYLVYLGVQGSAAFGSRGLETDLLLAGAGMLVAICLLLFAHGARRIQYSTVGFLQYIAPTGTLIVAVLLYKEPFTPAHAICFGLVWTAIIIYSISAVVAQKTKLAS